MKKRLTKNLLVAVLVIAFFAVNRLPVLAGGGSTPYGPYGPHIPEPTGLADAILITIAAVSVYVAGLGFLVTSKLLNKKAN